MRRRLETPIKQYSIKDCALYALRGRNQLINALLWKGTFDELESLAKRRDNYRCWLKDGREVQESREHLRRIHFRIATLLGRVAPPDYRHSGVKKRSFVTNAAQHAVDEPMLQFDIRKFYPSTTFKHVYRFFAVELSCAADIAHLLATLCCFESKHLPTGGVHSEVMAFYVHKRQFDAIKARAESRGGRMSSYVDDIAITAPEISLTDLEWVRRRMKQHGLALHPGKSFVSRKIDARILTGVQLTGSKLLALSKHRKCIKDLNEALSQTSCPSAARSVARKLMGHYDHIAQVESAFRPIATGNRARLKKVLSDP